MAADEAKPESQALTVYCHNVLADAWVKFGGESFYDKGLLESGLLDAGARRKIAFELAAESQADIICFQEIGVSEAAAVAASELVAAYHVTGLVENGQSCAPEPNGCMILLRRGVMDPSYELRAVQLAGGTAASLVKCRRSKGFPHLIAVVSCHLDWGEDGLMQGRGIINLLRGQRGLNGAAVLWCGDFNKTPDDPFFEEVRKAGFGDGLDFLPELGSCGCTSEKRRLDYALYRGPIAPASGEHCPDGFSAGRSLSSSSLLGRFTDLEDLLRRTGSDHAPLAVAFCAASSEQSPSRVRAAPVPKGKGRGGKGKAKAQPRPRWKPVAAAAGGDGGAAEKDGAPAE